MKDRVLTRGRCGVDEKRMKSCRAVRIWARTDTGCNEAACTRAVYPVMPISHNTTDEGVKLKKEQCRRLTWWEASVVN